MVTLDLRNVSRNFDFQVEFIFLDRHTPLDVIKMVVERDGAQKPPKGSIWLMKMPAGPGWHEIDHFATFKDNGLDQTMKYDLIECPCPLKEGI